MEWSVLGLQKATTHSNSRPLNKLATGPHTRKQAAGSGRCCVGATFQDGGRFGSGSGAPKMAAKASADKKLAYQPRKSTKAAWVRAAPQAARDNGRVERDGESVHGRRAADNGGRLLLNTVPGAAMASSW